MSKTCNSIEPTTSESSADDPSSSPVPLNAIDHIAIAVRDLEQAITFFRDILGFNVLRRRTIKGARTGMISAELEANGIRFVLCQGTEPQSQVCLLIDRTGPGVAHIALAVDDVQTAVASLRKRGLAFDTTVIEGRGLTQAFSSRCPNTGMSFEFIRRDGEEEFLQENVQELFRQLESGQKY